ncbi:MAG: HK97 family phage prohead protease [Pseudomonadota bacterium]
MTTDIERRAAELEIRASGNTLEGYAAVFDAPTTIADFEEVITRGAFSGSLGRNDILGLVDHDPTKLLARTRNGSLKLAEDSKGLHFEIKLPDTSLARDIRALANEGSIGGGSIGFNAERETWSGKRRTLHAIDLREISVVSAWPAYPQTSVTARSALQQDCDRGRRIRLLQLEGNIR